MQGAANPTPQETAIENRPPLPLRTIALPAYDSDPIPHRDTWARIRDGLSLPHPMRKRVLREIDWYSKHQEYLGRTTQRARPYLAYIVRQVEQRGMPLEFALLPIVESAFQPFAYSPMGAAGLWQFIPATGNTYGLKQNWWYDGRRDVVESTRAALDYLSKLSRDFDGDWLLAIAAYNWGEGNVKRAVSRNRARGKPTDVWSLKLPRETRAYVPRLLAIAAIVADPARYGVILESIPDHVYFQEVPLKSQISMSVAADLAGITLDDLYHLNPGFNHGATDPNGPHRLQLPRHAVERFRAGLAQVPIDKRVRWVHHKIAYGDTLARIAHQHRTTVAALKELNQLASDRIRAGRDLIVPTSTQAIGTSRLSKAMQTRLRRVAAYSSVKSIHVVRRGDSLWRIARIHRVGMRQLARWNGLSMSTTLQPGQRLTVHRRRSAGISRTAPARTSSPPGIVHVVKPGDTLSEIAELHGTTVHKLTKGNHIDQGAILRPGQMLRVIQATAPSKIPTLTSEGGDRKTVRYRIKRGDSLWEISRQFGVSIASLRKWNQLPKGKPLMPGRELDVRVKRTPAI